MLKAISAQALLDHALRKADELYELPVAVCVLDARGVQLRAAAQDGVMPAAVTTAHAKAATALNFKRDTVRFRHVKDPASVESDPKWLPAGDDGWSMHNVITAGQVNDIFCAWAGATLIIHPETGEVLGAIAVSGLSELEDHEVAASRPQEWLA